MGRRYKVEKKRKNGFKKFVKTYCILLLILMVICIIYVVNTLKKYESLQINNYLGKMMKEVAKEGEKDNISKYLDVSGISFGKFEKDDGKVDKKLSNVLKNSELSFKLNKDSVDLNNPVYDVYANGNPIISVKLNGEKKITMLGILTAQDWKVENMELINKDGIYSCIIEAPIGYKVFVNDIEVTDEEKVKVTSSNDQSDALTEMAKYVEIPYLVKYEIKGLAGEPQVRIEDKNGNKVDFSKDKNTFKVALKVIEVVQDYKEAMSKVTGEIDVMQVAKDWSLYLTDDLSGKTHGFYNINQYFIKDSYMWKYAYKWATNVDITFVSSHVLANPTFTNEKMSNFKIYSDKAFSCDVYLEKNFSLSRTGQKMRDVLKETMYFANYNGEWKLVSMQAITENK